MSGWLRWIPWIGAGLVAVYLVGAVTSAGQIPGQMHLQEFAKLPVQEGGRVKPIDTVARNSLMAVSNRQEWYDGDDNKQPAVKWLLDVLSGGNEGPSLKAKVFRIENDEVLGLLGLEPRTGLRYSLEEIQPKIQDLAREAERVRKIGEGERNTYEQKVFELASHVQLYINLFQGRDPIRVLPPTTEGGPWTSYADYRQRSDDLAKQALLEELPRAGIDVEAIRKGQPLSQEDRAKFQQAVLHARQRVAAVMSPAGRSWDEMLDAYRDRDADAFNRALADYQKTLGYVPAVDRSRAGFELFFNEFAPFWQCFMLYILVVILALIGLLVPSRPVARSLNWTAVGVTGVILAVHLFGLLSRMYISGRWLVFVTNLYSSAVFIGFGCAILGVLLEVVFRNGLGILVGSALGFLAVFVGHHLARGEDTLEMMRAVLDTNFWLATHVTCVTMGYMATFVAGGLGFLFIVFGVFTRQLDRQMFRDLSQMMYGVVCFATLLSFTGTVLGGIWADQSWGRFWGWDPKENGALLIVIANALILHARWAGMVKQRGMAVLTVAGTMITGWSWFGTNQLGIGLHSYGFNNSLAMWLTLFWTLMMVVIGIGLVPTKHWRSFGQAHPGEPPLGHTFED